MSKIMEIEAVDTLFFRDGKPFGESGDNWASSLTFPLPSTLYGALRAIYFSQNEEQFIKFLNREIDDPTSNLKINKIYFTINNIPYFILPYDLVFDKESLEENYIKILPLSINDNIESNLGEIGILSYLGEGEVERKDSFVIKSNFENYLQGDYSIEDVEFIENIVNKEYKIGIGRDKTTKNVALGKLYSIDLNRYSDDFKIIVEFEGLDIENSGIFRFGGEGKGAKYKIKNESLNFNYDIEINNGDIVKMYLLTPAIFKNGWYPDFLNENFEYDNSGIKLKLKAAAVGKPVYVGGWDINKPKRMFKAVPAGSVYYFEVIEGAEKIKGEFDFKSIVNNEQLKKEGFGIIILGAVK